MDLLGGKPAAARHPNRYTHFGRVSLNQVVTGELPFSDTSHEGVVTMSIIEGKVPLSIQGEQMSEIRGLFGLMTQCWALDPRDRPSAEECLAEVRRLVSELLVPTTFYPFTTSSPFSPQVFRLAPPVLALRSAPQQICAILLIRPT